MGNITPVLEVETPNLKIVLWSNMKYNSGGATADIGLPFLVGTYCEKTVQVTGTFGTGGYVDIEGSNDPAFALYNLLKDIGGDADLHIGASIMERIQQNPWAIRPRITAGDANTTLNVRLAIHALAKQP